MHRVTGAKWSFIVLFISRLSTIPPKPSAWLQQWPEPPFAVNQGPPAPLQWLPLVLNNNNKQQPNYMEMHFSHFKSFFVCFFNICFYFYYFFF